MTTCIVNRTISFVTIDKFQGLKTKLQVMQKKEKYKSPWLAIPAVLILLGIGFSVQHLFGTGVSSSALETQSTVSSSAQLSPAQLDSSNKPVEKKSMKEMETEQVKQLVTGYWKSSYYGTRHLIIREDGTATIYYQPNMLARLVMGGQLTIHYHWEYDRENIQVLFTATDGYPQKSYEYVLEKWGANQRQTVLDATEQRLLLLDGDDTTKHDWQRIEAIPESILKKFKAN